MVFMSQQKQSRLSPTQKTDIWRRWKALKMFQQLPGGWDNDILRQLVTTGSTGICSFLGVAKALT
jgi:hypothetical protein